MGKSRIITSYLYDTRELITSLDLGKIVNKRKELLSIFGKALNVTR
jgi:hypothetical protein